MITTKLLKSIDACKSGIAFFEEQFPSGKASFAKATDACLNHKHADYAAWLAQYCPNIPGATWEVRLALQRNEDERAFMEHNFPEQHVRATLGLEKKGKSMTEFTRFPKIPRYSRTAVITEKLDGTNVSIFIGEDGEFLTGSKNRWITPDDDNYKFSKWAHAHKEELLQLGPGRHFGEWWGGGIQRKYNLKDDDKRFSLFNVMRWTTHPSQLVVQPFPSNTFITLSKYAKCTIDTVREVVNYLKGSTEFDVLRRNEILPACVGLVPILWNGPFDDMPIDLILWALSKEGSRAVSGFMNPEGIVIHHIAANKSFKKTIKNDDKHKTTSC